MSAHDGDGAVPRMKNRRGALSLSWGKCSTMRRPALWRRLLTVLLVRMQLPHCPVVLAFIAASDRRPFSWGHVTGGLMPVASNCYVPCITGRIQLSAVTLKEPRRRRLLGRVRLFDRCGLACELGARDRRGRVVTLGQGYPGRGFPCTTPASVIIWI